MRIFAWIWGAMTVFVLLIALSAALDSPTVGLIGVGFLVFAGVLDRIRRMIARVRSIDGTRYD